MRIIVEIRVMVRVIVIVRIVILTNYSYKYYYVYAIININIIKCMYSNYLDIAKCQLLTYKRSVSAIKKEIFGHDHEHSSPE